MADISLETNMNQGAQPPVDNAPSKPTVAQFASLIKKRYPEYNDMDDLELTNSVIKKHPQYIREIDQQDYMTQGTKSERQKMFADQPWYDRALAGVGKGMMDIYEGAKQITPGLEADPEYAQTAEVYEEAAEDDIPSLVGELGGATAATIVPGAGAVGLVAKIGTKFPAIANIVSKSPKVAKVLGKILPGAAAGAGEAAVEFTPEEESRLQNSLYGGMFGAGGQLATKVIGKVGAKAWNAMKGKMKDAPTQELIDLATKYDVPLSFGDVSGKPIAKKAEVLLEEVPVLGTGKFREEGGKKATKAIKEVAEKYKAEIPGDDVGSGVQKGMERQLSKVKGKSKKLYDSVEELSGEASSAPKNAINTGKEIVTELSESDVPSDMLPHIKRIVDNMEKGKKTFKNMRKTRSDLSAEARKLSTNDPQGERYINKLRSAIEKDMDDLAKTTGNKELSTAYKKANKYYKDKVVPFREDRALKSALKSNKPDEIFNTFIKRGKKDRAQNFYNSLDEGGQSSVRYGMIEEAMEKSVKRSPKTNEEILSPARFAKHLEDLKDARGVFFKGEQAKELDGFTKLMRAAERFGQYGENQPTGAGLIPLALGGGAVGTYNVSPLALGAAVATTEGLKRLLTSKAGRNLLLASSKIKPDSPQAAKLVERASRMLGTASGVSTAKAEREINKKETK